MAYHDATESRAEEAPTPPIQLPHAWTYGKLVQRGIACNNHLDSWRYRKTARIKHSARRRARRGR